MSFMINAYRFVVSTLGTAKQYVIPTGSVISEVGLIQYVTPTGVVISET